MPCSCQNKDTSGKTTKNVFTVQSPSGKKTSFGNKNDADLYAARTGGKVL